MDRVPQLARVAVTMIWAIPAFAGEVHDAAEHGDLGEVRALLKNNPDLARSRNDDSDTPLHAAAFSGHKDVVEFLLASKADGDAKNNDGVTPLLFAAVFDHKDAAELLLLHGADVNGRNKNGGTPLAEAARMGWTDVVELLLANRAAVDAKGKSGWMPLHEAAF